MTPHPNRNKRKRTTGRAAIAASPAPATRAKARPRTRPTHDHDYSGLLEAVTGAFADTDHAPMAPLFTTDATDLYELYLDSLPSERQVHTCSACRRFIETYGGLVRITEHGETLPAMWCGPAPSFYEPVIIALHDAVKRAKVTGVFLSSEGPWGQPSTGPWSHMAVVPPVELLYPKGGALTAGQAMAVARENLKTVTTALDEFAPATIDEALRILRAAALRQSERYVSPLEWLRGLHDRPKGPRGRNLLWRAVALAPDGYCHPRASMTGTLLEDIAAGMDFPTIKKRFDAKMDPLIYQRPQVAPSAGNLKAAEALVAKLGIAPSLERRFARVDELVPIWLPHVPDKPRGATEGGVFSHIKPKGETAPSVTLPRTTMTWVKFARDVLPSARQLEIGIPSRGAFIAFTTAVNPDAPPILKWDSDDARNPAAWYCYPGGSLASQWGLRAGTWGKVLVVSALPNMWGERPMAYLHTGVMLAIEGAHDTAKASGTNRGNALFPECLRSELHEVRASIEAYSRVAVLAGGSEPGLACGYDIRNNSATAHLRVFDGAGWTEYQIDRWE